MDRTVSVLLLRVAAVAGLLMAVWVAMVLLASNASAEDKPLPPKPPRTGSGLIGGLVGNTLSTLDVTRPLVSGLVGTVSEVPLVDEPVDLPLLEPQAGVSQSSETFSAPAAVSVKPPAPPRKPAVSAPAPIKAAPVRPAPKVEAPVEAPRPVVIPKAPAPKPTFQLVSGSSDEEADRRTTPEPPAAPAAPAAPGSTASAASDGGGHARGLTGMLAGRAPLTPPASAGVAGTRVTDAAGRCAGLPASSPD
ncbi:hypothetical protein [Actinokineospora alba]|uniref:hypothetical protein n=1 Tax=Actinokineospora alba TaxID=504798 RepID=UPI00105EE516|nr:hypothetical protein [Actinokineospora alba]